MAIEPMDDRLEMRALDAAELEDVNGGILHFLLLGLAAFEVGFVAGGIAANYKHTGKPFGDYNF